jgi:phospholipid/cholesterol/gamma-HCH transport system permease protein
MNPESVGRSVLLQIRDGVGFISLIGYVLTHLRALLREPVRLVFYKQIYFTGLEALGALGIIAALSGIVITSEIWSLAGHDIQLISRIMLWTIVRELGPLLAAIVVIARSSSATASELANMSIRGEFDSLRRMGIHPYDYLVVPRVVGITVALVAVTGYFQLIAVLVGFAFHSIVHDTAFLPLVSGILSILSIYEIFISLLKATVFGLVIAGFSCLFGVMARGSVTVVPRAATRAVMRNIIAVFFLDGLITYLAFI